MGTIRLVLALAVVLAHLGHPLLLSPAGIAAVQAFFLISGFYITMALETSYRGSAASFWVNRALRLYPAYVFVAAVALAFRFFTEPGYASGLQALPGAASALLWLSNAVILGQDWVMFFGVVDGQLKPMADFSKSHPELWTFLLIPPAWSLGVELTFYTMAPLLLRLRTRYLLAIIGASILVRVALAAMGLHRDPWNYRFFPNEVALFLVGAVVYRMTETLRAVAPWLMQRGREVILFIASFIVLYAFVPGPEVVKRGLLLACMAITLPTVFQHSKNNSIDRYIGDLSYPLYISHWTTLAMAAYFFGKPATLAAAILTALVCILVAVALSAAIDTPVQRIRARFRNRGTQTDEALRPLPLSVAAGGS